jgi:MFS family permease
VVNPLLSRTLAVVLVTVIGVEIVHGIEIVALLPRLLTEQLGLSATAVGVVISAYTASDILTRTPLGFLADRAGRRPPLLGGLLLTLLAIPALATLRAALPLALVNVANGIGAAALWPALYAVVADTVPRARRGVAMSAVSMATLGGLVTGSIGGNFLVGLAGFDRSFLLCGAVIGALLLVNLLFLPETRAKGRGAAVLPALGRLGRGAALLALSAVGLSFAIALVFPVLSLYGDQVLRIGAQEMAMVMLPAAVIAAALLLPFGLLADRGYRRGPATAGFGGVALFLVLAPVSTHPAVVAAGAGLAAVAYALAVPAWNALVLDHLPESARGAGLGLVAAIQAVGLAVGPVAAGLLWDNLGSFAPFIAAGCSFALAAAAVALIPGLDSRRLATDN